MLKKWTFLCYIFVFQQGGVQIRQFYKPGRFTFPAVFWRIHLMRNNTAFKWGVVKSSQVWILKYLYFKWSARLHSDQFGSFHFFLIIHNILSFQNLQRCMCKIQCRPMENLKISKIPGPYPRQQTHFKGECCNTLCGNMWRKLKINDLLYTKPVMYNNPNTFAGLWGRCKKKNYLPKEDGREGGEKSARSAHAGAGARTRDLPHARQGSPAACQGRCLDKQAFPCL